MSLNLSPNNEKAGSIAPGPIRADASARPDPSPAGAVDFRLRGQNSNVRI